MKRSFLCLESTSQSAVSPKTAMHELKKKHHRRRVCFFNLFFSRGLGRHETQMKVLDCVKVADFVLKIRFGKSEEFVQKTTT